MTRPRVSVSTVWYEKDASGAKLELGPATLSAREAEAISAMVRKVRNPVRLARTKGLCDCGSCLGCDVQAMRREHSERKAASGS